MRCAPSVIHRSLALGTLLALAACTHGTVTDGAGQGPAPEDPSVPVAESRAKGVVIATLQTHDKKVSILGSAVQAATGSVPGDMRGLRVVVRRTDGAILADGISIDQLRATDPALHALVTSAVAGGTYLDATLDERGATPRLLR